MLSATSLLLIRVIPRPLNSHSLPKHKTRTGNGIENSMASFSHFAWVFGPRSRIRLLIWFCCSVLEFRQFFCCGVSPINSNSAGFEVFPKSSRPNPFQKQSSEHHLEHQTPVPHWFKSDYSVVVFRKSSVIPQNSNKSTSLIHRQIEGPLDSTFHVLAPMYISGFLLQITLLWF